MAIYANDLDIERIEAGGRLRPLSDAAVEAIAVSMAQIGLLQPITVRVPKGVPLLVAGAHRLAAAKKLGWTTIACAILPASMTEDDAKLAEIDENLARSELSPAERAAHIGARKAIYERQHPETEHGGDRSSRQLGDLKADRFTADTAKKTGQSERKVQRDAHRAKNIPHIAEVVGTSLDKGMELDALAKLPEPEQAEIIAKAKAGQKVSVKTMKQIAAEQKAMAEAWKKEDYARCVERENKSAELDLAKVEFINAIWQVCEDYGYETVTAERGGGFEITFTKSDEALLDLMSDEAEGNV